MSKTFHSFFFDKFEDMKYPEQSYYVDALNDRQMITYVGMPDIKNFIDKSKDHPIDLIHAHLMSGYQLQSAKHRPVAYNMLYYRSMCDRWKDDMKYTQYKIDIDFDEKGSQQIVAFSKDDDFDPLRIQFSFDQAHDHIHNKKLRYTNEHTWQSFEHYYNAIKDVNVAQMNFCITRSQEGMEERKNNKNKPFSFLNSPLSNAGRCIAFSMGMYLRKAIKNVGRNEDVPLIAKVFQKNNAFTLATLKESKEIEQPGFGSCTPYTDMISTPATLLNRIQIESFMDNGKTLFTETQLSEAAQWMNELACEQFSRENRRASVDFKLDSYRR